MNIHLYLMHCENIRGWLLLTSWGMYGVVHWNMDELAHLKAQCWFLTQTTMNCTYLGELLNFYKLLYLIWKTGYLWAQNKVMCVKHSAKRLVHNGVEKSVAIIFLIQYYIYSRYILASLVAQGSRISLPMLETWVRSLAQDTPLEKEMATHSNIFAREIP